MYLLIHEEATRSAVEADLQAELEVEMANPRPIEPISELLDVSDISELASESPIRVFRISRWSPKLVPLLDTHVTRLERTGAQFLFLTTSAIAEQLLVESPNFRNRLTDVLRVIPEDLTGGASY
jgi:hypothetical protein